MRHSKTQRLFGVGAWRQSMLAAAVLCMVGALRGNAQVYPVANCAEYYTAPGAGSYIAHWGWLNAGTHVASIPPGIPQNFFVPGPTFDGQWIRFAVGMYPDTFDLPGIALGQTETWYMDPGTMVGATVTPIGAGGTPSPTCTPAVTPVAQTFSQPGVYLHQYLGQVGGATRTATVVALSTTTDITLANVSLVIADSNAHGYANPNSIYADVTVAGSGGTATVLVEVLDGGTTVGDGVVAVAY